MEDPPAQQTQMCASLISWCPSSTSELFFITVPYIDLSSPMDSGPSMPCSPLGWLIHYLFPLIARLFLMKVFDIPYINLDGSDCEYHPFLISVPDPRYTSPHCQRMIISSNFCLISPLWLCLLVSHPSHKNLSFYLIFFYSSDSSSWPCLPRHLPLPLAIPRSPEPVLCLRWDTSIIPLCIFIITNCSAFSFDRPRALDLAELYFCLCNITTEESGRAWYVTFSMSGSRFMMSSSRRLNGLPLFQWWRS